MAKIDPYLHQLVSRGASLLRLDPNDLPMVELPGGHRVTLSVQDLQGPVLDGLAKEIMPEEQLTPYLRGEKVTFEHTLDGQVFQVLCCRTPQGARLVAARYASHAKGSSASSSLTSLDPLIFRLVNDSGSDLYLNGDELPLVRLNGQLATWSEYGPVPGKQLEELVRSWVPARIWEAYAAGQDTEFSHNDPALPCRLRVTLLHEQPFPSLAVRVIPRQAPDADTLGLSGTVRRLASLNKGLVLLTGPMGSGKSTTQACLLQMAHATRTGYLVTIQDAIEFEFGQGSLLIRQREVGGDPVRQKQAIAAALRQAPDILAVGEIRDAQTLDLALQAVQTGRMVLGTLATASLVDTLFRLAETFPPEHRVRTLARLADALTAILGHTLLPKIGGGQVVAMESLFNNPALAALIRDDQLRELPAAMKRARYGQLSHNDALVQLIVNAKVEPRDAYLRCQDRESFIAACREAGVPFDPRSAGTVTED
jgi:twitching motility protein PilT